MSVLVVGSGAREHAIAWRLSQSSAVSRVFVAPGNAGISSRKTRDKLRNLPMSIDPIDFKALLQKAKELNVDLVVPGADTQVVGGLRDECALHNIPCFAPSKATARLEGSKAFAKDFMVRHQIPTAQFASFTDYAAAAKYVQDAGHDLVIKASGLAAGKGVVVTQTKDEAKEALREMMLDERFGAEAAAEVVIEEKLEGYELSILTFSDGKTFKSMATAQDHKRAFNGDLGPNTGGMGCVAPVPAASQDLLDLIDKAILRPTFEGIKQDGELFAAQKCGKDKGKNADVPQGLPAFCGVLFTGIMVTKDGPKVLEYNVRPGDPEMQTLLPLLHDDCDLFEIMIACTNGTLAQTPLRMNDGFCVTVVMASGGYPAHFEMGKRITWRGDGSEYQEDKDVEDAVKVSSHVSHVFHAATYSDDKMNVYTSGGRVLCVAGIGQTVDAAAQAAYETVSRISFDGCFFRTDIGYRHRTERSLS